MTVPYQRSFARHETFYPRYGWLRKAVINAAAQPDVFLSDSAIVTLGVGKNMVRAIRYWGAAYGLLADVALPDRARLTGVAPTPLGKFLLGPSGADPYLEEPASLWLLHWRLARRSSLAPAWYLTFNRFPHREFADDQLVDWIAREIDRDGHADIARSSIEKDVSCLLRMYGPPSERVTDTLVSPFAALRLVDRIDAKPLRHRITYGPKAGLPAELVALVALDLLGGDGAAARSIGVARLATDESSPGRIFGLGEIELAAMLEEAAALVQGLSVGVFAGARRLTVKGDPNIVVKSLLTHMYPAAPFGMGLRDMDSRLAEVAA